MKRIMKNSVGQVKIVKEGFSWTMLFFGALVPLFRGDLKWFVISIIAGLCTFGLSWLVLPFIYNKYYIEDLIKNGYKFE